MIVITRYETTLITRRCHFFAIMLYPCWCIKLSQTLKNLIFLPDPMSRLCGEKRVHVTLHFSVALVAVLSVVAIMNVYAAVVCSTMTSSP